MIRKMPTSGLMASAWGSRPNQTLPGLVLVGRSLASLGDFMPPAGIFGARGRNADIFGTILKLDTSPRQAHMNANSKR